MFWIEILCKFWNEKFVFFKGFKRVVKIKIKDSKFVKVYNLVV